MTSKNKYAEELERSIFNWYLGGENASPEPIFNAINVGIQHDMELHVGIELPDEMMKNLGIPDDLQVGDSVQITDSEPFSIKFHHLVINDGDEYYVPVFTSHEAMEKHPIPIINISAKKLLDMALAREKCLGYILNLGGQTVTLSKDLIQHIQKQKPQSHISFIKGSVVDMHAGAIVNAAKESLLGGGGVDGAIHDAAGPELLAACRKLKGCKTGSAKITGSFGITHADYIIHAVGPVYRGKKKDAQLLASCYTTALDLALENGCMSIAFPCISTGVYGYPLDEAAYVSLMAVVNWLDAHPDIVMNIYFCCFRDEEFEAYQNLAE